MDAQAIAEALLTPKGRADPYALYASAHELGPVSALGGGWFLVNGYAAASEVLRNPAFTPPGTAQVPAQDAGQAGRAALASLRQSVLRSGPPVHGRMRGLLTSAFTPRRVAAMEPAIEAAADGLCDRLAAEGAASAEGSAASAEVDFMDGFAYQLPVSVICELLGVPASDRATFRPLAGDLTAALELIADGAALDAADAAARDLRAYFTLLIQIRRAQPRDDLLTALISARDADDGRLSEEELLANVVLLLVAGFETTTDLLGNGIAVLLDQPSIARSLRSGAVPVDGFIQEVLRWESPVQFTTRVAATADLAVASTPVPAGSTVLVLLGAANRDPSRYEDPDVFDPARTGSQPLSFGGGPHFCLGSSLAQLEARTAFSRLLARFPDLAAAPGGHRVRRDRLALRGYHKLPVTVSHR